jgi:hypothetical protein
VIAGGTAVSSSRAVLRCWSTALAAWPALDNQQLPGTRTGSTYGNLPFIFPQSGVIGLARRRSAQAS